MSLFLGIFSRKAKEEPVLSPGETTEPTTGREAVRGMLDVDPSSEAAAQGRKFFQITALKAQLKAIDAKTAKAAQDLRKQEAELAKLDVASLESKDIIRLRTDSKAILGRLELVKLQVLLGSEKLAKKSAPGTLSEYQLFTKQDDEEGLEELKAAFEEFAALNLGDGLILTEEAKAEVARYNEKLAALRVEVQSETVSKTKAAALRRITQLSTPLKAVVTIADRETQSLSENKAAADRKYTKRVASRKLLLSIAKIEETLNGLAAQRADIEAQITTIEKS